MDVQLAPTFYVHDIPVYGDALLSPMDGYSDWPFRSVCRELGSAMSYTEFVNVADILQRPDYVAPKLHFTPEERPVVIQIYGDDPDQIVEAALRVQELGPDIIDLNMGCPAKSVSNRGAGVGLMRTPLKIARIFRRLSATLEVPLTGKIRLGWDDDCLTYPLVARIVEENGGQLLAVHGRTRVQGYGGQANWDAIAEVVQAVSIPVIGNGDVNTVADLERMKAYTGCQAVMVGRAAIANPWIFARLERAQVSLELLRDTMLTHLERNLAFYGPERGLVLFRKYAARYLTPYRLPKEIRQQLLTRTEAHEFLALLDEIYAAI
ncbi:MAG: tRNA-dihydrouridine synthase [Anaerolineales bacterium]|nr:tRNA-dihydrouridine synthase [Anaerolineales bacterium]